MARNTTIRRLARRFDLKLSSCPDLTIRRKRRGRGFCYETGEGTPLKDAHVLKRLKSLAVPPAYTNVRFAADPRAHLQAVGEDAAGRVQYRYHPDWTLVRETLKAQRLEGLAEALPVILRAVRQALGKPDIDKDFALAAAVQLVAVTAVRAGSDKYVQEHGTRGATTLLKSHVRTNGEDVILAFRGKGGKAIRNQFQNADLCRTLERLKTLPGSRLFQYRDASGTVHPVRARDVNAFLKAVSGRCISLKDFRTLTASLGVLDQLGRLVPEQSARGRNRQIRQAIAPLADVLANTLSVCRTSYVHDCVIEAFEAGKLTKKFSSARSPAARMRLFSHLLRRDARSPARVGT